MHNQQQGTTFQESIPPVVMFKWNVLLDLSGWAATKTLGSLNAELLLQVLC